MAAVRVKICGTTSLEDALAAIDAGADALGFIFFPGSSRAITPANAAAIIAKLPPLVSTVGVFVNSTREQILAVQKETGISTIQFHGEETPEFCAGFDLPTIKAWRVTEGQNIEALRAYQTTAWLLDSYTPGKPGGTGRIFNWNLVDKIRHNARPLILAGGLNPDNVAEALVKVRPFGVDVASGVEASPGKKDRRKMERFVSEVKRVEGTLQSRLGS